MSSVLLEKIPFPDLSTYVISSVVLLFAALFHVNRYYFNVSMLTHRFSAVFASKKVFAETNVSINNICLNYASSDHSNFHFGNSSVPFSKQICGVNQISAEDIFDEIALAISQEPWCFWSLINIIYCALILLGKTIQNVVFGELRIAELNHIRDKFWNFVFYKFIFVFGILYVNSLYQVLLWSGWYSILGFLHLLTHLTKDRFEYLMQASSVQLQRAVYVKLIGLLAIVLMFSGLLSILSVFVGLNTSLHNMFFMLAEIVLLCIVTLHVIGRFILYLKCCELDRSSVSYYMDLCFDLGAMFVDMAHHIHMLLWSNMFLSMASLVIFMQLRYLYYQIRERFLRHQRYRLVFKVIQNLCPLVCSQPECGEEADLCPICWDELVWCRQLPCNHNFHENCLRLWLEQELCCPTCRRVVSLQQGSSMGPAIGNEKDSERIRAMLEQVCAVFPHLPRQEILRDLRQTRNAESTIENILEGRLNIAYAQMPFAPQHIFFDRTSRELASDYVNYSGVQRHHTVCSESLQLAQQKFEERKRRFCKQAREDFINRQQSVSA